MRTIAYLLILIGLIVSNPFAGLLARVGLAGIEGALFANALSIFSEAVRLVGG